MRYKALYILLCLALLCNLYACGSNKPWGIAGNLHPTTTTTTIHQDTTTIGTTVPGTQPSYSAYTNYLRNHMDTIAEDVVSLANKVALNDRPNMPGAAIVVYLDYSRIVPPPTGYAAESEINKMVTTCSGAYSMVSAALRTLNPRDIEFATGLVKNCNTDRKAVNDILIKLD